MQIAFLVTAYNNPNHFHRLVRAVTTPYTGTYVHVDAKSDIRPFQAERHERVKFLQDRFPVYWGEFTMVQAVLRLIDAALNAPARYDYLALISGTDYPIRPMHELQAFLSANNGTQFMNIVAMPNEGIGKPLWRLRRYKVLSGGAWSKSQELARRALIKAKLVPAERRFEAALGGRAPYAGSTWWVLSRDACEHVLEFVRREKAFVSFYRHTWFPDEGMIHTIIGNSPFASRLRRNLTYTDWRLGGAHPALISDQHVDRFISDPSPQSDDRYGPGEVFFARKFSDDAAHLTARLDELIASRQQQDRRPSGPQHVAAAGAME